jgi:proteic killer suppression protein
MAIRLDKAFGGDDTPTLSVRPGIQGPTCCEKSEASEAGNMNLPGFRLHPLKGDLAGFWAVTVSGNWRIVFRFARGHADDVDLIDYH